jgi:hypothetical protein
MPSRAYGTGAGPLIFVDRNSGLDRAM